MDVFHKATLLTCMHAGRGGAGRTWASGSELWPGPWPGPLGSGASVPPPPTEAPDA